MVLKVDKPVMVPNYFQVHLISYMQKISGFLSFTNSYTILLRIRFTKPFDSQDNIFILYLEGEGDSPGYNIYPQLLISTKADGSPLALPYFSISFTSIIPL